MTKFLALLGKTSKIAFNNVGGALAGASVTALATNIIGRTAMARVTAAAAGVFGVSLANTIVEAVIEGIIFTAGYLAFITAKPVMVRAATPILAVALLTLSSPMSAPSAAGLSTTFVGGAPTMPISVTAGVEARPLINRPKRD